MTWWLVITWPFEETANPVPDDAETILLGSDLFRVDGLLVFGGGDFLAVTDGEPFLGTKLRASSCDFAIWAGVIRFATISLFSDAFSLFPDDAAMLNHIWART